MIPEAAVEAAARALFERTNSGAPWDAEDKHWWNAYVDSMCTALEAAAPHMLAGAATRAPKHQCEPWQVQVNSSGTFRYCAARGEPTP